MADAKISALPSASTPLAGTEVLPIVQSGVTDKITVNNLAAGNLKSQSTTGVLQISGPSAAATRTMTTPDSDFTVARTDAAQSFTGLQTFNGQISVDSQVAITKSGAWTVAIFQDSGSNLNIQNGGATRYTITSDGNLIPSTAAKGINFTANTPAAGKTSQLLNWYEEGIWTPNQGAGLTVVGAFSSSGTYTRIGRQVTVRGQIVGATSVAVAAAGVISTNLPFSAAVTHAGSMFNGTVDASGVVQITSASVVAANAISATASITFTAVYTV